MSLVYIINCNSKQLVLSSLSSCTAIFTFLNLHLKRIVESHTITIDKLIATLESSVKSTCDIIILFSLLSLKQCNTIGKQIVDRTN